MSSSTDCFQNEIYPDGTRVIHQCRHAKTIANDGMGRYQLLYDDEQDLNLHRRWIAYWDLMIEQRGTDLEV